MASILHLVDLDRVTPETFLAVVEIPAGSKNKYELDKKTGALILDRVLFTATHYPHNYGFIPRTWGLDDDPLDVMIITSEPVVPLALVRCKPIGVLEMVDSGKVDEKIIAVSVNDPFYEAYNDIAELPRHIFDEIKHFFSVYKALEVGKYTEIEGFDGPDKAKEIIARGIESYQKKFPEYCKKD